MADISLCDIDQTGIFSGKDVFLDLRAEIKQVYDLVQAEKADTGPAREFKTFLARFPMRKYNNSPSHVTK